jgi:DNA-directed RNA polymerase specialized sigma24 family protein
VESQTAKLDLVIDSERAARNDDVRYAPQCIAHPPLFGRLLPQEMSLSALAQCCMQEIDGFRRGEPSDEQYGVELFRRAVTERDPLAWEAVQQCFHGMLLRWMSHHPMIKAASCFDSEENYVAEAFARFWQATAGNGHIEFQTLAAGLLYLRACLNGTLLDTLRAYSRPREMSLPESGKPGEPVVEESDDGREVWEIIRGLIPNDREQRVAYLLFHCGLKPREIVHFCQEEFPNVEEIYRLRRNIVERLLRKEDQIRWRLNAVT